MATRKFKNEARPNERQGQQSSVGRHVMKTQDIDEATFAEIMGQIHSITNTRTQVELAEFLGIGQSSISDAKKRRSIPSEWLLKLYWEKKVNPGWVMAGRGGKYLQPSDPEADIPSIVFQIRKCPPEECSAQELFTELLRRSR